MSNQVFASQEQRLFAQYVPTSFQVTQVNVPDVAVQTLAIVPVTTIYNFDDSFLIGANGILVQKAGIYSVSYDIRMESQSINKDFQAETYISVSKDDAFTGEIRYCRTGARAVAVDSSVKSFGTNAGSITTFLPVGYVVKLRIENFVVGEPLTVKGSSKMEVIRLL